jgi:DnaD/phage-associated family protein
MPLCAYGDVRMRVDHTQIENAFIRNFMPFASGDAVKVYLYGLMQCQSGVGESTIPTFALALSLSERDVHDAFLYWQDCGLVRITDLPSFSVLYQSAQHALPIDTSLYTQSELSAQLQTLFLPSPVASGDLTRMYEWVDVFKIQPEAVVMLIVYGRSKMPNLDKASVSRQLSYIGKIARQWADEGVHTQEDAEVWLQSQQQHQSGLTSLLNRLGMRRSPTQAERKLYQKWLAMGFNEKSIAMAADRTIGIRNPSLDSVDNILLALKQQGLQTPEQLLHENSEILCKEALTALGLRQPTPSPSQLDAYRQWQKDDYPHEHILLACELCKQAERRSMRDVTLCLERWRDTKLSDGKSIRKYETARTQHLALLEQAFTCMGMNRHALDSDLDQYNQWAKEWNLPDELILFAAESAHGANSPYRMMKKLLQSWHEAGIKSVSQARKQFQEPVASAQNPALRYAQRPVDDLEEDVDWM